MNGPKTVLKAKPSITSKLTMPPHKPTRSTHSSSSRQIIFIYIFTTRTDLHFWSVFCLYSEFYIQLVYKPYLHILWQIVHQTQKNRFTFWSVFCLWLEVWYSKRTDQDRTVSLISIIFTYYLVSILAPWSNPLNFDIDLESY